MIDLFLYKYLNNIKYKISYNLYFFSDGQVSTFF